MILRAEKGYVIVGKDTDGSTMPHDLGRHRAAPCSERTSTSANARCSCRWRRTASRKQLVGLEVLRRRAAAADGRASSSRVLARRAGRSATSPRATWSPTLDRAIALGLVVDGAATDGREARRLSSRRRTARPHRLAGRARSGRKAAARRRPACVRRTGRPPANSTGRWSRGRASSPSALTGLGQTLVSGDLEAAIKALASGAPLLGLYELAPKGRHALRIARDRALLVTPAPLAAEDGFARRLLRDRRRRRAGRSSTSRVLARRSC